MSVFCFSAHSQTTLNVTQFGAVADAEGLTVSCVSNSSEFSIVSTNWAGTNYAPRIGDVIEVFRAGPWLTFSNDPPYQTVPFYGRGNTNTYVLVTNQDIICLITNITEGTNLWCPIPAGWNMNAYCVVGTNNAGAFQSAVTYASNLVATAQDTNVTIHIPAGTYLLIPSNALNPNYVLGGINGPEGDDNEFAVRISVGGITLSGDSESNTVLMGCGAGMEHDLNNVFPYNTVGYFNPLRGTMFLTGNDAGGGIGVVDSQYPLVFQNLTMDGGLTNGYCADNQYWILNPHNGDGWDTTHHCVGDFSWDNGQMHQRKAFENCTFQHWRGEMIGSGVGNGGTNTFIGVTNCVFNDGCASGFNFTFANSIVGCLFTNVNKVLEFYQSYAEKPCLFESNVCSVPGNTVMFTIVGSVTNVQPQPGWDICDNSFLIGNGGTAIQFSPAENVVVSNNVFTSGAATAGTGIIFDSAGLQPADGSATMCSNIVIEDNSFNLGTSSFVILADYEDGCLISNNIVSGGNDKLLDSYYSGFATNILVVDNQAAGGLINVSGVQRGQYPVIATNNVLGSYRWDLAYPATNQVDWSAEGPYQHVDLNWPGSIWCLATNSLIPPGSFLSLSNGTGAPLPIYYDSSLTSLTNIASKATAVLHWNGVGWATPPITFTAGPTIGVESLSVQFNCSAVDGAGNPIQSWSWNFGDGTTSTAQNPVHTYTALGTFYPQLTVVNVSGQQSSGSGPAITVTNPIVSFAAGSAVNVAGAAFQFTSPRADSGGNSIASWTWNFGDGAMGTGQNPVHTYTALGTFYPVLTATNVYGVSSMGSGLAITVTNPVVKFAANLTNVCPNYPIQFTSPSVDSGGNAITGWQWNFGDGTGSTAQNPTHTYAATGEYHPVLSVQDAYGLSPASSGPSSVNVVNPGISFSATPTNGVSRLNVQFQSPAADSLGVAIAGWHWTFGDGSTGAGQNPAHAYSSIGTFYPVLVVTNSVGDLVTNNGAGITVTNPVIQFTATPTNLGPNSVVQFSSPSADSGGNAITSWHWDFGDGTTSTAQNPTHSYASAGTYHPVLSVQNTYGLTPTSSGTAAINVANPTISFSFSPSNGVSRLNVQFQSPASDSQGVAIAGWHWNFGDGSTGVGENPLHTYTNIGTFYPVLVVTNSVGTLATNDGPGITVTNPVIPFTVNRTNSCPNLAVQFSAPATDSGGNPVASWTWNFGDGTQGSGQNPAHSYATNGTYHPVLSALNAYGISATGTGTVVNVVNPGISFTVTPTNGMSRLAVQFQSPAADSLGVTVTGWHWDFGDGSVGVGENPAHTYTNLGTFYPVLTATNSVGVLSTNLGDGITVTNPMIAFTVTPGSGNASLTVQFQSPSTDTGGNAIQSWNWNFGDGTTGTGENPTHTYTKAGNYYPVLLATNIYGVPPLCSGSPVSVAAAGTASANIAVSPPPPPLTVTGAGATAILSWPATADNCTVQWTTNMGPGAVWFTVNSPAVEINGQYVVTNVMASSQMYFRLKQTTASSSQSSSPPSGSISDLLTWLLQHGGAQ